MSCSFGSSAPRSVLAVLLLVVPLATEAYSRPRGGGGSGGGPHTASSGTARSIGSSRGSSGRSFGGQTTVTRRPISPGNGVGNSARTVKQVPHGPAATNSLATAKRLSTAKAVGSLSQQRPGLSSPGAHAHPPQGLTQAGHKQVKPMHVPKVHAQHVAQHLQSAVARQQIQHAIACAPHRIGFHRHCHWWFPYLCGVYHYHHRPWVCNETYWTNWTPCSFRVVRYQSYEYYVGLECITVPDIQALGVQTVQNHSPAARAGIQEGDLLVSVNGRPLVTGAVLTEEVATGRLVLEVLRDGATEPTIITVVPELVASQTF